MSYPAQAQTCTLPSVRMNVHNSVQVVSWGYSGYHILCLYILKRNKTNQSSKNITAHFHYW